MRRSTKWTSPINPATLEKAHNPLLDRLSVIDYHFINDHGPSSVGTLECLLHCSVFVNDRMNTAMDRNFNAKSFPMSSGAVARSSSSTVSEI